MKCPTCGDSKRIAVTEWDVKLQRFVYREKVCPTCEAKDHTKKDTPQPRRR